MWEVSEAAAAVWEVSEVSEEELSAATDYAAVVGMGASANEAVEEEAEEAEEAVEEAEEAGEAEEATQVVSSHKRPSFCRCLD